MTECQSSDVALTAEASMTAAPAANEDPSWFSEADLGDHSSGRGAVSRFLDSFFQEKNIRWMLVIGAAIVFGSSLMLVTDHWQSWPVTVKYLTVLGYTAALFGAAEIGRRRLGLRTTAVVLHLLTILMMPLSFLTLSWLSAGTAGQSALLLTETLALMVPATLMTWSVGARVFDHLLHRRQTTFLMSYVLLSVCGALPGVSTIVGRLSVSTPTGALLALLMTAAFWAVMSLGIVKVNRHVFWLSEQHQWPRVFGFFPVALLGLQFLMLSGFKTIGAIPVQWLGLMLVLTGATILQTTRTIADVFRQRTGNLIRPLPLHISMPLFIGLALALAGVGISFQGFRYVGETTFAVVPTCGLAAVLMMLAARDTRHRGFVWAALVFATIAYQCAPTMFADVVQQVRQSAATALHEQRLPMAFYGLTYLPLVAVVSMAFRRMQTLQSADLSRPLKQFATIIVCMGFVASMTNLKAAFVVSIVDVVVFIILAVAFADRRLILGALLAAVVSAAAVLPFVHQMQWFTVSDPTHILTCLAGLGLVLVSSHLPDRLIGRIPLPEGFVQRVWTNRNGHVRSVVQLSGFALSMVIAGIWSVSILSHAGNAWTVAQGIQFALLAAVFVQHTMRSQHYFAGLSVWVLSLIAATCFAAGLSLSTVQLLDVTSVLMSVISLSGLLVLKALHRTDQGLPPMGLIRTRLMRSLDPDGLNLTAGGDGVQGEAIRNVSSRTRLAEAFVVPLCDLSLGVLLCLAASYHLGRMCLANVTAGAFPLTWSSVVTVVWMFAAGKLFRNRSCLVAGTAVLPLMVTGMLSTLQVGLLSWETMPLIWAVVASVAALNRQDFQLPGRNPTVTLTDDRNGSQMVASMWLTMILVSGIFVFSLPIRLASIISLLVLITTERRLRTPSQSTWLAITANLQLLLLVGSLVGLSGFVPIVFRHSQLPAGVPYLLLTTALSALVFDRFQQRLDLPAARSWLGVLRLLASVLIFISFASDVIFGWSVVWMLAALVLCIVTEWKEAVRRQLPAHVWSGIAVAALGGLWLFVHEIVTFGSGVSQFVLLGVSVVALVVSHRLTGRERLAVFVKPARTVGLLTPLMVALLAVGRQMLGYSPLGIGWNSLALFLAAGVYFQQWMMTRTRGYAVTAGFIVNVAFLMLWQSLNLTDPQFYMVPIGLSILALVELLKRELPTTSHDPLRYVGSLVILVSPVFHILGGSWMHLMSLMVLCVLVILLAIGLRLRALVFTGTAFLLADLVAMVVRGAIDHPALLWLGGLALGLGVIALAAFCENHREKLLQRIRILSVRLATWN